MGIVDIIILILIIKSGVTGFKKGFFNEILDIIAIVFSVIMAFKYMGLVADLFYQTFPFFNLKILGVSIVSLNIFLYQVLAFVIMALLIYAACNIVITITGLFRKIASLKLSPKFDLLHSIFGAVVGALNGYVLVFVFLIIISPFLNNFAFYRNSSVKNAILYNTPILTKRVDKYTSALKDVTLLADTISNDKKKVKNSNKYNLEALDIMLKYKVVSVETISSLNDRNRLTSIKNVEDVINKYKEEDVSD